MGVNIGDNCVIGSNAVVTKNFLKNSIIAGVPAKVLKKIYTWNFKNKNLV